MGGGSVAWEDDVIRAFLSLTSDEAPVLELIVIDAVVDWLSSDANPGGDYSDQHAGHLVSTLYTALDTARTFRPSTQPAVTDEIAAARARVVEGAHEIAAARSDGIGLVVSRLMPSILAELSTNAGERGRQAHGVVVYLLYAVAVGTSREHVSSVMDGLTAAFVGWDAVLRDGYVVPWRTPPAAASGTRPGA